MDKRPLPHPIQSTLRRRALAGVGAYAIAASLAKSIRPHGLYKATRTKA